MSAQQEADKKSGGYGKWIACGCICIILAGTAIGGCVYYSLEKWATIGGTAEAIAFLETSPVVTAQLGTPLELSGFPTGDVNFQNDTGTSDRSMTVKGPKGSAEVHYYAEWGNEQWTFTTLDVELPDGQKISLIQDAQNK